MRGFDLAFNGCEYGAGLIWNPYIPLIILDLAKN